MTGSRTHLVLDFRKSEEDGFHAALEWEMMAVGGMGFFKNLLPLQRPDFFRSVKHSKTDI